MVAAVGGRALLHMFVYVTVAHAHPLNAFFFVGRGHKTTNPVHFPVLNGPESDNYKQS